MNKYWSKISFMWLHGLMCTWFGVIFFFRPLKNIKTSSFLTRTPLNPKSRKKNILSTLIHDNMYGAERKYLVEYAW